jgi:quaternary ammonium compound-resistance protein SugE
MAWVYLLIAGIFEVLWAIGLKYQDDIKLNLMLATIICAMALSVIFLQLAMKTIPIGTAYTIWTGIGILGVTLYDIYILNEPASAMRITFLSMIFVGIVGLKLASA